MINKTHFTPFKQSISIIQVMDNMDNNKNESKSSSQ